MKPSTPTKPLFFIFALFLLMFLSGTAQAQNFRASASAGAPANQPLSISKPAGTIAGDVMIAAITVRPSTATITAPLGWKPIRKTDQLANGNSNGSSSQATYWKVAATTGEPTTYSWTLSNSTASAGGISTFYNINNNQPINAEGGQATPSSLNHSTPSVTTTVANTMVITTYNIPSSITWTVPGMTKSIDRASNGVPVSTGICISMNYVAQTAAGVTGIKTATASNYADNGIAQIVTLVSSSSAIISYAGTPFCNTAGATAVTLTGTTGGTFSSTSGLSLNLSTGAVTPSTSIPGNYVVTYKFGGIYPTTTTANITIANLTVSGTSTATCVGGSTGSITATAVTGLPSYSYSLDGGAYQASNVFNGLAAQNYTLNVNNNAGCIATSSVLVSNYANSNDNQFATGNNTWIGHMYDGIDFGPYIGQFTEPETFIENFGGSGACFNVVSNSSERSINTETFSVKYKMTSTKKGLHVATLGSDDGSRLTVDGAMVYNNWTDQSFSEKPSVLMNLNGSSSLMYEFYEQGGENQAVFQVFTQLLANTLTLNTTQSICAGNAGLAISGDVYSTLPSGITLSGTGYQWSYSTTLTGARTTITGATGATFTPSTSAAPFNVPNTYYFYRNASLSSTNNVLPVPYIATNESNAATIIVSAAPSAIISYTGNPFCGSTATALVTKTGTGEGTYSSTTGLVLDAATGKISISSSTPGNYTVTYMVAASGGCSVYTTTATVNIYTIFNNQIDYTSGIKGVICSTATENGSAVVTAPEGAVFINVGFASYGSPSGTCAAFTIGSCHASTSQAVTEGYLLGNNTATIPAANGVFGDPCVGTVKQFFVQATYSQPICSGTAPGVITGTTPTGATGTYTYLWEKSTTSATSGFSAVASPNNTKDYTPGILTQTTWFRRTVMSGGCSSASPVMQVTVKPLPVATISYGAGPYCSNGGTANVTLTGTAGGLFSSTPGLTINAITGIITPGTSTIGSYTVTYTMSPAGGCSAQTTASVVINALPAATIVYSGSPFCKLLGAEQAVTRNGTTGGVYTSTAGLTINSTTGAITTGSSTVGTYLVTYTIAPATGCGAVTATTSVTIAATPSATISYGLLPYCTSSGTASVVFSGTTGGTYTAPSGLSINAVSGAVILATSTGGTYPVTYTVSGANGCSTYSTTTSIIVTTQPVANGYYANNPYGANSGIAYPSGGVATGAAGILSVDGGLTITALGGVTLTTPGTYTVSYTVLPSGGCPVYIATSKIIVLATGTWTGALSPDWNTAGNWPFNATIKTSVPTDVSTVTIPTGSVNYPVINGVVAVKNIIIQPNAMVTVSGGTLQIGGTITSSGIFNVSAGTVEMKGIDPQIIPNLAFSGNAIKSLIVNNAAGVTLAGALSLSDSLSVPKGTFTSNGYLTLKSTAAGTARVSALPVDANGVATTFITGKIAVERYLSNKRAWRLLTAPLSTTGSIYDSWQNLGAIVAGSGIFITGPKPSDANGLDASAQNTISMKTFDTATQAFKNITNTKVSTLSGNDIAAANVGYFVFVRGDRNPNNLNAAFSSATTVKSAGQIQTGKQTFIASSKIKGFTIMGNPYASPVDFNKVQLTNLTKRFYAWDPAINKLGAYVVLDDPEGDGTYSSSNSTSLQDKYIQSGQAFFVQTIAAGAASLTYNETSKGSAGLNTGFRPAGQRISIGITLNLLETDNSILKADAALVEFSEIFSGGVNMQDAVKFTNVNETLSLLRDGTSLAIERRPIINLADTLFLKIVQSSQRNYQLVFKAINLSQKNLFAFLEDKYTGSVKSVNLDSNSVFNFTINTDSASMKSDRFRVVFKQSAVLPVTFTDVTAIKQGNNVAVQWKVENQLNIQRYEVERSADGSNFAKLNTQSPTSAGTTSATYNWLDTHPVAGDNFYRIRNVDLDGATTFSKVVKATMGKVSGEMTVYPNPVTGGIINLQLNNMAAGQYNIRLVNTIGQIILTKEIGHTGGSATKKITLPNYVAKGIYKLEITNEDIQTTIGVVNQ